MHAICNPQHQVAYPALANTDLMDVMRRCLDRDPKTRISLQVRCSPLLGSQVDVALGSPPRMHLRSRLAGL
jgi:hypothetical protein